MSIGFPAIVAQETNQAKETIPQYAAFEVPELSLTKLRELEPLMRKIIGFQRRTEAIQSLSNFLHTIYYLKGEAFAEQIFGLLGISMSGGYRLLSELRKAKTIKLNRGKLVLTDFGRRLYDGSLTENDIDEFMFSNTR